MPEIDQFADIAEYYSTVYHEAVHSTGHTGTFTNLNNAVIGYKNLQGYDPTLAALVALKPTVPEKYSKVASLIETASSMLHGCYAAAEGWIGSSSKSTMDLWGNMEPLYWHDSVNTLAGLYYMDSRMGN